ncbi:hypothetical protein OTU49_006826 [Cherax quadricarinatus]|uniref:Uncharacterized protein n=1 Tax=Cherax quadricarinatus TaxID=27406 RepID=A0AAW0WK28_CHEQU
MKSRTLLSYKKLRSRLLPPPGVRRSARLAKKKLLASLNSKPKVSGWGTLSIYLRPTPRLVPHPKLDSFPTVQLQHFVHLPATINGKPCVMFVDSGSTSCIVKFS